VKATVFANPEFLYLLALLPVLLAWYILRQRKQNTAIRISSVAPFSGQTKPFRYYLKQGMTGFRFIIITLLIIVLSRPQSANEWEKVNTEGIDIALCMDVSGSMQAMDFKPDRLEAAKDVAAQFINGRQGDRFAIVAFSGESFTLCPLTSDKAVLINQMKDLKFGMIEDGTAIGMGLATSVNRLKNSKAKSKVIILLTDGVNNRGTIGPVTAAEIASENGIRTYTIGVGTMGTAPMPVQTVFGRQVQEVKVEIDEKVLKEVAEKTGGQYFRATDNAKLAQIYQEIDKLEKTILDVEKFSKRKDEYFPYLLVAVALFLLEILLRNTYLKNIP
jgi:Ca-activated chloride channel homolog